MESRQAILAAIRGNVPPETPLPDPAKGPWIRYENRLEQFAAVLQTTGGLCLSAPDVAEADRRLRDLPAYRDARKIVSLVEGLGDPNVDLQAIEDPHLLEDVDFAIVPGEFGVAENGAVWVSGARLRHRAVCFIPQHVALALPLGGHPQDVLVDNMHQAYQRLAFDAPEFGVFISGPSKTADIEQALVIGAHGPRSVTVIVSGAERSG